MLAYTNSENLLPPKLVPVVNQRTQSLKTYFQFVCSVVEGSQPLFFEWSRNGQSIRPSPDTKYHIDNSEMFSTFIIKSIEQNDAGNYSCLVKNAVGSDSRNVLLTVKGKACSMLIQLVSESMYGAIDSVRREVFSYYCRSSSRVAIILQSWCTLTSSFSY